MKHHQITRGATYPIKITDINVEDGAENDLGRLFDEQVINDEIGVTLLYFLRLVAEPSSDWAVLKGSAIIERYHALYDGSWPDSAICKGYLCLLDHGYLVRRDVDDVAFTHELVTACFHLSPGTKHVALTGEGYISPEHAPPLRLGPASSPSRPRMGRSPHPPAVAAPESAPAVGA